MDGDPTAALERVAHARARTRGKRASDIVRDKPAIVAGENAFGRLGQFTHAASFSKDEAQLDASGGFRRLT
jgi:hypothetical protein